MGFGSLLAQARKNFASLVRTGFAAVAKASCKHGLWLVAREKKEPSVSGRLKNFYANKMHVQRCTLDDFTCSFVLLPERFGAHAPYTFGIQLNGILQSALHVRFLAIPNTSTGETMW